MGAVVGRDEARETVTVRYWAGARAAAGTAEESFDVEGELTLAEVVARVLERHPGGLLGPRRRPPGPLAGPGLRGRAARVGRRAAAALRRRLIGNLAARGLGRVASGT